MKDKFATFAEKCDYKTSEIDFEPPIGSGELDDTPCSAAFFACHHPEHPELKARGEKISNSLGWCEAFCCGDDCPLYLEWGCDEE